VRDSDEYVRQVIDWLAIDTGGHLARVMTPGIRALYGLNFGWLETAKICLQHIERHCR
jgi:ribosomal silencing factor RsfS